MKFQFSDQLADPPCTGFYFQFYFYLCIYVPGRAGHMHMWVPTESREATGSPEAGFTSNYKPTDMGSWRWNWKAPERAGSTVD